jgi:quaternary ammonium compound-resistance protein SugE
MKVKRNVAWLLLVLGGCCEASFTFCLGKAKEAVGNATYYWYAAFIGFLLISMLCLIKATQTLPIGTAYAVWTGIGAVGAVLLGIFVFKEPATLGRIFFLTTLIVSIIGLKFVSN